MKKKLLNLSLLFLTVIVFGPKLNAQCLEPTAFTSTTITANTADITWTAGGSEGDWNISWGTPGYTPGDIDEIGNDVSTTNSFGITNLSPNIQYDAYVQADCGGGDESAWEGPLNFTTLCTPSTGVDTQTACGSFTWTGGDGAVYTASNNTATYTFTGGAANGCDSIVTLDLTINIAVTGTDTQSACGSFTWTGGDGAVYTSSNNTATYTFTGGAANGCDSIVTLDLTINSAVTGTDTQSACGSFTWTGGDGAVYTSSNNTATYTFTGGAANGCDFIVTLDLTINSSVTGTDTQSACGSYTWIDGVEYTANENSATYTLVGGAANGCDSIVTLNLTMHPAISAGNDNAITVCLNEPVNLAPLLSSGADAGGTWIAPNGSTLTNTNVIASSVGSTYSYKYVVSSPNCDDVIAVITFTVDKECDYLAVSENILETISVYPNPATTQLKIINPSNESSLKVEVLDMNGRVVLLEKKALNNASEATIAIDHLEKGIYTLRVYNEEGQRTFKIVKQ